MRHSVWPRASYQSPIAILRPCRCKVLPRQWSTYTYNRLWMATKVVMLPNVPQHRGESQDQPLGSGVIFAAVGSTCNAFDSMLHPREILFFTFAMPYIFPKIKTHGKKWHLQGKFRGLKFVNHLSCVMFLMCGWLFQCYCNFFISYTRHLAQIPFSSTLASTCTFIIHLA